MSDPYSWDSWDALVAPASSPSQAAAAATLTPDQSDEADYWHSQGMTNAGVAGMLGAASQEAPQGSQSYNDSSGASGTYQYLGSRAEAEAAYAQARGQNPWSPQMQNEYANGELRGQVDSGNERGVGNSLFHATDPAAAADSMVRGFERPGAGVVDAESARAGQRAAALAPLLDQRYGKDGAPNFMGVLTDNTPTLAHIVGAQAPALAQQLGVDPNAPLDLADPATRQALNDAGVNPDPYRPIPAPQPTQPGVREPKVIGPFSNSYDAYDAAPKDRQNYYLLNRGGSWLWQPKGPGLPADRDPTKASPYLDDTAAGAAMNRKLFQSPQVASAQIGNGVTNIGRAFNKVLANTLDLPATVADWGLNAISAGLGRKPTFQFGHPVEGLMNRLGFETDHRGDDGWSNFGWGIGTGLGMAATVAVPGAAAAAAGPEALAAGAEGAAPAFGSVGRTALAKASGFGQGVTTGTAANEIAAGGAAGLGQEEGHEFYKSQTGRQGDLGDYASQFLGGGLFNAVRIPLFGAAEKAAGTAVGQAWQGAKAAVAAQKSGAEADAPLNAVTGKQVTDQVLAEQLARHLDHADETVAALGTSDPSDSANYLAERSEAARAAVNTFAQNSRTEERAMWQEVNPSIQIDYSNTRQLYAAEKAAHFNGTLRDPADFPTWLDPLLGRQSAAGQQATGLLDEHGQPIMSPADGLQNIDTLGRGQNLRARLNQAIDDEKMAVGRAQNPALLGYLQRVRNSLGQDMENTSGGVSGDEIDAYRRAMAFSKSRAEIMESEPMSQFLNQRVGDASALQKFLRQGLAGADATKILLGAAQAKYGSGGLLSAAKDAMRQMYTDAVAPRGFVDTNAHNQFMKSYSGVLGDPAFSDVAQQLDATAAAARDVNGSLGAGRPTNFGRTESALDQRTAAAENYLGAPTDTVLRNLEGSSNALHGTLRVLGQLDTADATGRASLGFQHQVAQRILDQPGWAGSNQGIIQAIDRRNPGFAERAMRYTSSSTLAGIAKKVGDIANAWVGARLGGHLGEGLGSSMVLAGRGANLTEGLGRQVRDQVTRISSANIVDPAADAAWHRLTTGNAGKLYTAAQHAQDMMLMHSYVPGLALGNLPIGSGTGTGDASDRAGPPQGSVPWQQLVPAGR